MTRPYAVRLPPTYTVRYVRRDGSRDMTSFTVRGCWNKLDADIAGRRLLAETGEDPDQWWAYGAERVK